MTIVNEAAANAALIAASNEAQSNLADFGSSAPAAPPPPGSPTGNPAPDVVNNGTYLIYGSDSQHVQNAQGCNQTASLIMWTVGDNCSSGSNEVWEPALLSNGYDIIRADYDGYYECQTQEGADHDPVNVLICPAQNFPASEQFREPGRTPAPCASGWYYIVPSSAQSLTENAQAGPASGHHVVLYPQSGCPINDLWYFQSIG